MIALGVTLAAILLLLAALHAYWGIGGFWPGTDAVSCARTVGGFTGARSMPGPAACFGVAGALGAAALVALAASGALPVPAPLAGIVALGAALVFLGRGIAGFTPAWRRLTPEQPFAWLDVRYYSPLCLAIGAGLFILAINGFSS
jgi:hypothetical protein